MPTSEFEENTLEVRLQVNGKAVAGRVTPRTLLVNFLREHLGLTGAHVGCDTTQCGACTVHVNGRAIKSCTMLTVQAEGQKIRTIEDLGPDADHPLQKSFHRAHALQCGFCTPGMIMLGLDLLSKNPEPTEDDIKQALEGNYCRCTGYEPIIRALLDAAREMRGATQ